jgi:hypothetical protein
MGSAQARPLVGIVSVRTAACECGRTVIRQTVEYQDAFADFAEIYLEDSWVLDVAATEHGVSFRLDGPDARPPPVSPARTR